MRQNIKIVGRRKEQAILKEAFDSGRPEFIALYGRRRVGKTHLVKNFFEKMNCNFLYISGLKEGTLKQQLKNFVTAMESAFIQGLEIPPNWMGAFKIFTDLTEKINPNKKVVLFLDELPWLVTKKSKFLQALDYYWNRYWSHNPKIKLIVCGSAASWIIKNIIYNKGGLYNRVTRHFQLEPFTLREAREFLVASHVRLNNKQIAEIYMVTGGIPYYLINIKQGLSAAQNIENLAFNKNGVLYQDFVLLFKSLFEEAELYNKIVRIISKYRYGINQEELFEKCRDISKGGRAVEKLKDLEQAGFIVSFLPYTHKKRGVYYRIIDEYTNFYIHWVEQFKKSPQKMGKTSWLSLRETPKWKSWAGYTFETICFKHISQVRKALNINPSAVAYTWRHGGKGDDTGAQIDLLFDRQDDSITVCEIKYTEKPFIIDKEYFRKLNDKIEIYKNIVKTKKQIFLAFIASSGLKKNIYSEEGVSTVATLEDLFKQAET